MGEGPGRTPRIARRAAAVVVGMCVALAAVAGWVVLSSDDDADTALDAAGTSDGELPALVLEPGDELPNGFVVADGTSVRGGVFPEQGDRSAATFTSSSVQIEVPGDMTTAVRAYLDQAVELGHSLVARNHDDACWRDPLETAEGAPAPDEPTFVRLRCGVTGTRSTPAGHEQFRLEALRTYPVPGLDPVNSLRIEFSATDVPPTSAWRSIAPGALPEPGGGPPAPEVPLEFPGAVDPLCGPALEVVEGSEILAVTADCGRSSRVALAVTGDPDRVYGEYLEQIRQVDPVYSTARDSNVFELFDVHGGFPEPGRRVHSDGVSWDDGSHLEVRLLDGDGVPAPTLWIDHVSG